MSKDAWNQTNMLHRPKERVHTAFSVRFVSMSSGSFGDSLALLIDTLMTLSQELDLQIALDVPDHTQFPGAKYRETLNVIDRMVRAPLSFSD